MSSNATIFILSQINAFLPRHRKPFIKIWTLILFSKQDIIALLPICRYYGFFEGRLFRMTVLVSRLLSYLSGVTIVSTK